ncbi:MAG: hypothetical protein HY278_09825 [candidate division NC10 bacterium]|nr:hypothetical protein [candidate division NC10 bacterium]
MKNWTRLCVVVVAGVMLWSDPALGEGKSPGCGKAGAPEKVEGQVVKVDMDQGKLTVRGSDGTTHEFQASKETLVDYKVGDRISATLRSAPDCPK